jgi:hypothetical protein
MHQILAGDCFCKLMTYLRLVDAQRTVVRANPRRVHNQNIRKSLQETTGDKRDEDHRSSKRQRNERLRNKQDDDEQHNDHDG